MAYGDQPSLIIEQIEWERLNGFWVVCDGKGSKYHPTFEYSTPETVWGHYGLTKERDEKESGMNPKMFNSFLCGDKSAIEMCAVSNASNLKCPSNGLTFPPVGVYDIAKKLIPKVEGGLIDYEGQVEVISSIDLNQKDIPVYGVKLEKAFPITMNSIELNQDSQTVLQMSVTFAFDKYVPEGPLSSTASAIQSAIPGGLI